MNYSKICGNRSRYNEPRYDNEIPAITNWFWRSQRTIYPAITNILSWRSQSVKNDMMIHTVDKANMTPIGQDRETDFQSFALFKCSCSRASLKTVLRGVYPIVQLGSAWLPCYNEYFCCQPDISL